MAMTATTATPSSSLAKTEWSASREIQKPCGVAVLAESFSPNARSSCFSFSRLALLPTFISSVDLPGIMRQSQQINVQNPCARHLKNSTWSVREAREPKEFSATILMPPFLTLGLLDRRGSYKSYHMFNSYHFLNPLADTPSKASYMWGLPRTP